MRARMALTANGVQCEVREIVLKNKPVEMLEASPKGTVPVLVLETGEVIDESLEVMKYACAVAQKMPLGWHASQLSHPLIDRNDHFFKFHLDRYKYAPRYEVDPLAHFTQAAEFLKEVEASLKPSGNGFALVYDVPSLLDIAIFPFIRQFYFVDPARFESLNLTRTHDWLTGWLDDELFSSIMVKLNPWQLGDKPIMLI